MSNPPFVFSTESLPQQGPKKPPDILNPSKVSFRDKLLGSSEPLPTRMKEDLIASKQVRIEYESGNRLFPKVYLDNNVFQGMCTPWKDALVVTLLGKKLGYHTMKERLQKVWKLQGGFEIMDNDNGFYMVKFDQAAEKERVISDGPWMIFDHYLAVSHWTPEFASPDAKVDRTVVWIRFPGLNLVYYDESFLLAMASAIGRPIKVDHNTLKVEKGRFARVCVEVDLTLPVVGKIWLNGHWYKVQYEGLHIICTNCGCYGHLGRNCNKNPISSTEKSTAPSASPNSAVAIATAPSSSHRATTVNGNHQNRATSGDNNNFNAPAEITETENGNSNCADNNEGNKINAANNEENNSPHGDWLTVTRKKKSNPKFNANNFNGQAGNRNGQHSKNNIRNIVEKINRQYPTNENGPTNVRSKNRYQNKRSRNEAIGPNKTPPVDTQLVHNLEPCGIYKGGYTSILQKVNTVKARVEQPIANENKVQLESRPKMLEQHDIKDSLHNQQIMATMHQAHVNKVEGVHHEIESNGKVNVEIQTTPYGNEHMATDKNSGDNIMGITHDTSMSLN
jgi:hypothetical protein